MSGAVARENEIFDTLQAFTDAGFDFVVVGGYAVSAFQHRFSVDADLVVSEDDLEGIVTVLEERGFEAVHDRDLVHGDRYLAYETRGELPVTIDLLVNSLQCRQTDARWSYDYFLAFSTSVAIKGMERTMEVRVPERELQIAVKLHSGRLTDARDVVALATDVDVDRVRDHADRGDPNSLHEVLIDVKDVLEGENFQDAFKGVFSRDELPRQNVRLVTDLIDQELERTAG